MTTPMLDTGALTDLVIAQLTATGLLVGDGIAPAEGGWTLGQPNVDRFVAYTVVGNDGAAETLPDLMLVPSFDFALSLRHYGGSRKQLDHQARLARQAVLAVHKQTFGDPAMKIIGLSRWRLGAVSRVDDTDPPSWRAFDSVNLACS